MWNKQSLRIKLTVVTALVLTIVSAILTISSITGAHTILNNPGGTAQLVPADENDNQTFSFAQTRFAKSRIIYMIVFITAGTAFSYYLVGKTLKPITNLSKQMETIDENGLKVRVTEPDSQDEVSSLASSFNKMLEKLDTAFEEQKRFSHNVAHELKTPVAAIIANIDVLEMDEEPNVEEMKEVIAITKENANRLSEIIKDVLSLNEKFDSNAFETFELKSVLNHILKELEWDIKQKNISISFQGTSTITGNKSLLDRAFFNLLQNAVKYCNENGVIRILCETDRVQMSNTGTGIPKESIDKIWLPFYRVDASRSRDLGGSGLGLSIVKSIMDKHGFRIGAESVPNEVTTFSVYFS